MGKEPLSIKIAGFTEYNILTSCGVQILSFHISMKQNSQENNFYLVSSHEYCKYRLKITSHIPFRTMFEISSIKMYCALYLFHIFSVTCYGCNKTLMFSFYLSQIHVAKGPKGLSCFKKQTAKHFLKLKKFKNLGIPGKL